MPSNAWEEKNRLLKVAALVDKLREHQISADLAQLMDREDWIALAGQAGVIPPSDESKAQVIKSLRAGEPR